MRFLRSFLIFLVSVILFLVAFNYAASGLWKLPLDPVEVAIRRWIMPPETVLSPSLFRILWGGVALMVVAVWLLTVAIWRARPRAIQSRSSSGEMVLIHPGALLKFVRLQVESHPAVVSQRIRVRQKGSRGISIWTMVQVQPIDSLPNIKRQLEDMIRNSFAQVLGIEKLDEVTIIIGLDEKTLSHRPGPTGVPASPPEPPARGTLDLKPQPQPAPPVSTLVPPVTPAEPEPPASTVMTGFATATAFEPHPLPLVESEEAVDQKPAEAEVAMPWGLEPETETASEAEPETVIESEPEAEPETEPESKDKAPEMPKFFPRNYESR